MDVTKLSDYALGEGYFDLLDECGSENERVMEMREEMEERDLLFEGYRIHDWTSGFRVRGCPFPFKRLEDLKDYIIGHRGIEPTVDGSMYYTGYTSDELSLKPEDCEPSTDLKKRLTEIVDRLMGAH